MEHPTESLPYRGTFIYGSLLITIFNVLIFDPKFMYSRIFNNSTGTIEKNPPKSLAVHSFFAVLLPITQKFELLQ